MQPSFNGREFSPFYCLVTIFIMLILALNSNFQLGMTSAQVMGASTSGNGTLREWLSSLKDESNNLQSSAYRLQKAIDVLSSSNNTTSIVSMRSAQLKKINQALDLINQEISIINSTCLINDGPDCSIPVCNSKCLNCSSAGKCALCSNNFDGFDCASCKPGNFLDSTCSSCKSGWSGSTCSIPICDSKCVNCTSPGNCSLCCSNWIGSNCSSCKTGYCGSYCNVTIGDLGTSTLFSNSYGVRLATSVLDKVITKTPKLLYRAMTNGYHPYIFHSNCDGFASTVTIVKTSAGAIFGAYLSIPWENVSVNGDTTITKTFTDPNAFLFSMITSSGAERFVKLGYSGTVGQTVTYNYIKHPLFGASDIYLGQGMNYQPATDAYSKPANFHCF